MASKSLKIDQLKLDLDNPRIGSAADQRQALKALIDEVGSKLIKLAENIIERKSMNPLDRLLVMLDTDKKYIVLEGNRRIAALKILLNPNVLSGIQAPKAFQKQFEEMAKAFDRSWVEPLPCWVATSREEVRPWIEQRHQGEDEGRGIVTWSAENKLRWAGRHPAVQALDFVKMHGGLTKEELALLNTGFPITTLDRLLQTPTVRAKLGLDIVEGKLQSGLAMSEVLKPLRRIVLDLATKRLRVTQVKKVEQQHAYIDGFNATDLPDANAKTGPLVAVEDLHNAPAAQPKTNPPQTKTRAAKPSPPRLTVVPRTCHLNVTNNNTLEIYEELRKLKLNDFPNAIAVLMRVFVENSVDHYLSQNGIDLRHTPAGASKPIYKTLKAKMQEAMAHLVSLGTDKKDFDGVNKALSDRNNPFSIDLQHAYVHNRYVTPNQRDLIIAWDNGQVLFEKIWP